MSHTHLSKAQVKRRITEFLKDMEWAFDFQNFLRTINFKDNDDPPPEDKTSGPAAYVEIDWEYQRITINIFPCFFDSSIELQRTYLLHEFCHTFSDKLYGKAINLLRGKLETSAHLTQANEECTSRITELVGRLLEGKMRYARDGYANYIKPIAKRKKVLK